MSRASAVVEELRERVSRLEAQVQGIRSILGHPRDGGAAVPAQPGSDQAESVLAALRAAGLIREPSSEELAGAAAWDARPEEERRDIEDELRCLRLEPPLSEIIVRNRAGGASQ